MSEFIKAMGGFLLLEAMVCTAGLGGAVLYAAIWAVLR